MNEGRIVSSDGLALPATDWEAAFREEQVEGTNALHARTLDGGAYLVGPAARVTLAGDRLHPLPAGALGAPRGLPFHRYEIDERGRVAEARIVPPTSQNQAAIEEALVTVAPGVLDLPEETAQTRIEQLGRSYDPCTSCPPHFLELTVEREP